MDTKALSYKTSLKDRDLYYDGDSVVDPNHVLELVDKGFNKLCVTELTDEIKQYNKFTNKPIRTKTDVRSFSYVWNLPEPYNLWSEQDVVDYIIDLCCTHNALNNDIDGDEADARDMRVSDELHLYKKLKLIPVLRTIIYVINTLQDKNIVWGVGRGSSVSSYVLYLIGVHDVDSVKYELDISDFLRLPDTT